MNKKKFLLLALVLLLATLAPTSLAWFQDEDKVTNTFTIGSVEIEIEEDFDEPEDMIPVVNDQEPEKGPNFVNKDAWTVNTGKNPAYIQMLIALPKALDDAEAFHIVEVNSADWEKAPAGTTTIEGIEHNVYRYRYKKILPVKNATSPVITGAYLDPRLDYNNDTGRFVMDGVELTDYIPGTVINVYIVSQAIQSEGFSDYQTALETFDEIPAFNT